MMYEQFVKEFIERTKSNYLNSSQQYKVTMLINSMIGLLIIPKERMYQEITNSMISDDLFNELSAAIKSNFSRAFTLQDICRHIRNAVAHSDLSFQGTPLEIESVTFSDNNKFEIQMTIQLLEKFLFEFSDAICKYVDRG